MKRKMFWGILTITTLLISGCSLNNNGTQSNSRLNNVNETDIISVEEARQIALAQVPGATLQDIREFKSDYENGRMQYESKIYFKQNEYKFAIDAYTGEIHEWDVEPIHD